MHIMHVTYLLLLLPFLTSAAAAPDAANKPKPSATPTQPPKPPPSSSCSRELLCCLEASGPASLAAELLLDLLHIDLTSAEKNEEVGLTCNTLQKRGLGECSEKPMCCDKSFESGIIAIGCEEVSI